MTLKDRPGMDFKVKQTEKGQKNYSDEIIEMGW